MRQSCGWSLACEIAEATARWGKVAGLILVGAFLLFLVIMPVQPGSTIAVMEALDARPPRIHVVDPVGPRRDVLVEIDGRYFSVRTTKTGERP